MERASQPRIRVISWTSDLVSRALVLEERSWDSLARRQGWVERWTVGGRVGEDDMVEGGFVTVDVVLGGAGSGSRAQEWR